MSVRTVTVREARANLVKLAEELNRTRQPIIVAEGGKWPLLVLLSYDAWQASQASQQPAPAPVSGAGWASGGVAPPGGPTGSAWGQN